MDIYWDAFKCDCVQLFILILNLRWLNLFPPTYIIFIQLKLNYTKWIRKL